MDHELFEPTMKTSSGELTGTIEHPALLVPPAGEEPFALNRSIIIVGSDAASN